MLKPVTPFPELYIGCIPDAVRWTCTQALEHVVDTPQYVFHISIGKAGRHEPHDFTIIVRGVSVDKLERIGVNEVVSIQALIDRIKPRTVRYSLALLR